jgi:hypothetical protein
VLGLPAGHRAWLRERASAWARLGGEFLVNLAARAMVATELARGYSSWERGQELDGAGYD